MDMYTNSIVMHVYTIQKGDVFMKKIVYAFLLVAAIVGATSANWHIT